MSSGSSCASFMFAAVKFPRPTDGCRLLLNSGLLTYSSVRKLVKLSAVQFMLNNHTVST